ISARRAATTGFTQVVISPGPLAKITTSISSAHLFMTGNQPNTINIAYPTNSFTAAELMWLNNRP
ncbi:MAG: hypothetical protein AAGF98_20305, partial [Cyanobacteria bacterium P01_H01_bin.153]